MICGTSAKGTDHLVVGRVGSWEGDSLEEGTRPFLSASPPARPRVLSTSTCMLEIWVLHDVSLIKHISPGDIQVPSPFVVILDNAFNTRPFALSAFRVSRRHNALDVPSERL